MIFYKKIDDLLALSSVLELTFCMSRLGVGDEKAWRDMEK